MIVNPEKIDRRYRDKDNYLMNIQTIDLNFQGVACATAAYVIVGPDGPVLVETGPGATLKTLLAKLGELGISPGDIKHVLLSHIHLDHAGAAGWWTQQGAQIYVHPFGAPHLIDPSKLLASASRIYGEQMEVLWGEMLPATAENVTIVYDGDVIEAAGLQFKAIETPGHARHHHVYRLGDIGFTGDAAGLRLLGLPLIDIPAPPPEFELDVWQQTVDRLLAENFTVIYPTHFGRVENVQEQLQGVKKLLQEAAEFVHGQMLADISRNEIVSNYTVWNRNRAKEAGLTAENIHQYETANPLYMSVDGIMRYWKKRGQ